MTFRQTIYLVISLLVISTILHAQDMERWLWIRPGRENVIQREPTVGKSPTGMVHRFFFEGRGEKLSKFCKEYLEDLAQRKEAETNKPLQTIPLSSTEITGLQDRLLQAAITASLSAKTYPASAAWNP